MHSLFALLALTLTASDVPEGGHLLREAGFSVDGPGAVKYLLSWVPDAQRQERLRSSIAQLGDDNFERREEASRRLREAGPMALADLRRAVEHDDPEIRRRARDLLDAVPSNPGEVVNVACGLIRTTRPPNADEALLRFAPFVPNEQAEQAMLESLPVLGLTPAVRTALTDPDPLRRRAAACALLHAGAPAKDLLRKALQDTDLRVRVEAARALVRQGDRDGLSVLVEAMAQRDSALAWRSEDTLWRIAREQAPPFVLRSPQHADRLAPGWRDWLREQGPTVDLNRLVIDDKPRDWILVADDEKIGASPGHVRIHDRQGKMVRDLDRYESPTDVQLLPGDRLLVAEHWANKVSERDFTGRILWEYRTAEKPVVALRQADGGTLIATYAEILELDRTGKLLYSFRPQRGMIYGLVKRPSGMLVFITGSGLICEADTRGTILREFQPEKYGTGAGYWASIELLRPDRYLLSLSGSDRVVEVDGQGKIHWEATAEKPTYAQRLPDGTTLVSCVDAKKYVILDAQGKTVRTVTVGGRPFRARQY